MLLLAVLAFAAAAFAVLLIAESTSGAQLDSRATVTSCIVAVISTLGSVLMWLRGQLRDPARLHGKLQLGPAGNILAAQTLAFWLAEARVRGLDLQGPAMTHWRHGPADLSPGRAAMITISPEPRLRRPSVAGAEAKAQPAPLIWLPRSAERAGSVGASAHVPQGRAWFDDLYSQLDPGDLLVLLGEAGLGKTAAMVMLLVEVLQRRAQLPQEERAAQAIPVWVTCGSWDPHATTLAEHVASTISAFYPGLTSPELGGASTPAALVEAGLVAVFLDGLDEMPRASQRTALEAINLQGLTMRCVLSSRTDAYRHAASGVRLPSATVVELPLLDLSTVTTFLKRTQPAARSSAWAPVITELKAHPQGALAQILRTPLGLTLARDTYLMTDPARLLDVSSTPDEVLTHLFGAFLDQAYPAITDAQKRHRDTALRELAWISWEMDEDRDLAWWDIPNCLPDRPMRLIAGSVAALGGVATGLLMALSPDTAGVPLALPIIGVVLALCAGLPAWLLLPPCRRAVFIQVHWPRISRMWSVLGLAIMFGPILVLETGAGAWGILGLRSRTGLLVVTLVAVLGGILGILVHLWRSPVDESPAMVPYRSYQAARRGSLLRGIAILMMFLPMSPVILPLYMLQEPVPRMKMGQLLRRFQGRGRIAYMDLLQEALSRQILRQAGAIYQFRHAQLQDHLAQAKHPWEGTSTFTHGMDQPGARSCR